MLEANFSLWIGPIDITIVRLIKTFGYLRLPPQGSSFVAPGGSPGAFCNGNRHQTLRISASRDSLGHTAVFNTAIQAGAVLTGPGNISMPYALSLLENLGGSAEKISIRMGIRRALSTRRAANIRFAGAWAFLARCATNRGSPELSVAYASGMRRPQSTPISCLRAWFRQQLLIHAPASPGPEIVDRHCIDD